MPNQRDLDARLGYTSVTMDENHETPGDPEPPLWVQAWVGVTSLVAVLAFFVAMFVWLADHRMGPFPVWLVATQAACSATLLSGRVLLWVTRRNHAAETGSPVETGTSNP